MNLAFAPYGEQVRTVALATRMFQTAILPWECGRHEFVETVALGRPWSACRHCGFTEKHEDRELLLRLLREQS